METTMSLLEKFSVAAASVNILPDDVNREVDRIHAKYNASWNWVAGAIAREPEKDAEPIGYWRKTPIQVLQEYLQGLNKKMVQELFGYINNAYTLDLNAPELGEQYITKDMLKDILLLATDGKPISECATAYAHQKALAAFKPASGWRKVEPIRISELKLNKNTITLSKAVAPYSSATVAEGYKWALRDAGHKVLHKPICLPEGTDGKVETPEDSVLEYVQYFHNRNIKIGFRDPVVANQVYNEFLKLEEEATA